MREIRPERRPGDDRPRLGHGARGRLPSKDVLVGYYEAMKACCRDYMSSVTDEELSAP